MPTYKMTVPQKADGTTIRDLGLTLTSAAHYIVETDLDLEAAFFELLRHGVAVATLTAAELSELPAAEAGVITLLGDDLVFSEVTPDESAE